MSKKGWVKLHRKIVDSDIFNGNPYALKFWIWLLASAAHEDTEIEKRGRYLTLESGEVCSTRREMAVAIFGDDSQRSRNRIGNIIFNMEINGYINTKTNSLYTLIHIEKWENYQSSTNQKSTVKSTPKSTVKSTEKSTLLEKPTFIKEEIKKESEEKPLSEAEIDAEWDALEGELV